MERLSHSFGKLLDALLAIASIMVFIMMLLICLDVLLRNVAIFPSVRGIGWSSDATEAMLYLITMLVAPWVLRQGQHVRVDILLVALPKRIAWYCEWFADILALLCCVVMVTYGFRSTITSYYSGDVVIKNVVVPDWWLLFPLPVAFALLSIELLFRMRRLLQSDIGPRSDAVSAG